MTFCTSFCLHDLNAVAQAPSKVASKYVLADLYF
jgi:hypothetical protein